MKDLFQPVFSNDAWIYKRLVLKTSLKAAKHLPKSKFPYMQVIYSFYMPTGVPSVFSLLFRFLSSGVSLWCCTTLPKSYTATPLLSHKQKVSLSFCLSQVWPHPLCGHYLCVDLWQCSCELLLLVHTSVSVSILSDLFQTQPMVPLLWWQRLVTYCLDLVWPIAT